MSAGTARIITRQSGEQEDRLDVFFYFQPNVSLSVTKCKETELRVVYCLCEDALIRTELVTFCQNSFSKPKGHPALTNVIQATVRVACID